MKIALSFDDALLACHKSGIRSDFNEEDSLFGIDRTVWESEVEGSPYTQESWFGSKMGMTDSGWDIPKVCFAEASVYPFA